MASAETAADNDRHNERTQRRSIFGPCLRYSLPLPSLQPPLVVSPRAEEEAEEGATDPLFGRMVAVEQRPSTPRRADLHGSSSLAASFERHQGVLWKRRDVFKNRWRPRWFVLQPGQGILTYYLLTGDGTGTVPEHETPATPAATPSTQSSDPPPPRDRATSWDSRASENTVDYDVVPRGTIYLLGCTVGANPALTKPSEHLYAFTIVPPTTTEQQIHLAARTPEVRDRWIERIAAVCDFHDNDAVGEADVAPSTPLPRTSSASTSRPLHRTSIPEHEPLPATLPRRTTPRATRASSLPLPTTHPSEGEGLSARTLEPPTRAAWKGNLGPPDSLYGNLPESLVDRLKNALKSALEELSGPAEPDPSAWKTLYQHDEAAAYRRRTTATAAASSGSATADPPTSSFAAAAAATVKMVATLSHPTRQVFEALVDPRRIHDVEDGLLLDCRRVLQLNSHTFVDAVAYPAVWPAAPRDLVVATHWQALVGAGAETNDNDDSYQAVVLISFSCPEADRVWESASAPSAVAPTPARAAPRVRGTVHLCATLLRPLPGNRGRGLGDASNQLCQLTRVLSIDLGGRVSPQLANVMLHQRAKFPLRLGAYLRQFEPTPNSRHFGPMTNESLSRDIVARLQETRRVVRDGRRKRSLRPAAGDSLVIPDDEASLDGTDDDPDFLLPPLDQQALLLLAPLLWYQFLVLLNVPSPGILFLCSFFWAVRQLVLLHIGPTVPQARPPLLGPITYRFRIDLKGVLRFIANKKEEREELKRGTADITVLHIVACAVAAALKKCDALHLRRVSIPWLGVDRFVHRGAADPVSVSFLLHSENGSQVITLPNVDTYNVQRVADEMKVAADEPNARAESVGSCLIVAAPNDDHTEMETDVLPRHPNVRVVCTVGEVHLERSGVARSGGVVRPQGPRPFLSLSLTVANSSQADFAACTRFAEDVQTLLQFPEMCDD